MNENIYEFILFLTIFLTIHYDHSAFSFISTFYPIRKTNFRLFESNRLDFYNLFGPNNEDYVWNTIRRDANTEATSEPLLASFLHASILSHSTLEKSLAFHLANQLASPAMIATQIQALLLEVFEKDTNFKYSLRQDILAVLDRDPAVKSSTDVILYFKGFQALQTHRVSHWLWKNDRGTLALFLNSRLNSVYNIDIHPGAKLGTGILIDHGTGIVIGATAVVGNNVSMLHQVTLGGAGKVNVERHPKIQDGVLLGAGATLLGNITIGEGSNIGARSMVVDDIPPNCVVVGVPARIIYRLPTEAGYPSRFTRSNNEPASSNRSLFSGVTMDDFSRFPDYQI